VEEERGDSAAGHAWQIRNKDIKDPKDCKDTKDK
jgi:hypothetical protein